LDRETGLVWERSPNTTKSIWADALQSCLGSNKGNRGGWHLPLVQELRSLVDPTGSGPTLPSGHPFIGVQWSISDAHSFVYWTANTIAENQTQAWSVGFSFGGFMAFAPKSETHFAWCVRGGQGVDPQ
jgi:hypothetical protein